MNNPFSKVTVIIPTLNEDKNIGKLLDIILSKYKGIHVIVADDGSCDRTALITKSYSMRNPNVILLDRRNEKIKGLCASVIDAAKKTETEFMIVIDGDLQHPPERIGEMAFLLETYDIVEGRRKKVISDWPAHRKIISKTATLLAKLRVGNKSKDPLSGFFGVKTKKFKETLKRSEHKFEKKGYKVYFDLLKYVKKPKIGLIDYEFGMRGGGESKIRTRHILIFLRSLFK